MTTKKSIIKVKNNGLVEYIFEEYEAPPKTAEQIAADSAWGDDLLRDMAARNQLIRNIMNAIENDNHSQFVTLMEQYHYQDEQKNDDNAHITIRKKNIHLFLDILQEEKKPTLIDNAVKYLSEGYIHEKFIIIGLWSLYHEDKTKELLSLRKKDISEKDYDVFFELFTPEKLLQSKLPLGITQEKKFLEERKQEFFNIAKVIFLNQLEDKIPNKIETNKKMKI